MSIRRVKKIVKQKLNIRSSVWPALDENHLWLRQNTDGWLSVPRSLPLLLRIIDSIAPKGKPVSDTYLDLWCRTFDDAFVIVSKPREMAYYAGFSGERAEHTWASRMKILSNLGFIDVKSGASGPLNYVLIYNPYHVIRKHHEQGTVNVAAYNALQARAIEIGAADLDVPSESKTRVKRVGPKRKKVTGGVSTRSVHD